VRWKVGSAWGKLRPPQGEKGGARKVEVEQPEENSATEYSHLVVVVRFGEAVDVLGRSIPNNYVLTIWPVFIYGTR
jgi:hypothetical protein